MVISCPKCKSRLKIPDEKIRPEGINIKCPKCLSVLRIKGRAPLSGVNPKSAVLCHSNPDTAKSIMLKCSDAGIQCTLASDGVDLMIRAMRQRPMFIISETASPKIPGAEIAKRLKARPELKGLKVFLISPASARIVSRQPEDAYAVDAFIEEGNLSLLAEILAGYSRAKPTASGKPDVLVDDPAVAKAKRLARIVVADIDLYNKDKVPDAIRAGTFKETFKDELKEGHRHYEKRIPAGVRAKGDFFGEALEGFIENKKKALGLD